MIRRLTLFVILSALIFPMGARAEEGNPFFAMDTIARGGPDQVVPLLQKYGYSGLGGNYGDAAMAEALKKAGLVFYNGYLTLSFRSDQPDTAPEVEQKIKAMAGHNAVLWLAISKVEDEQGVVPLSDPRGDKIALDRLRKLADSVAAGGGKIALYPHTGFWLETVEDAGRLAQALKRDDVGVTFNLCHWLKVEGQERDPTPVLQGVLPRLFFVTINGADAGDTKKMGWNQLIQPLGSGSYDTAGFVKNLRKIGYTGPIGFQGFGIQGNPDEVLAQTMKAWREMIAAE